jgi:hypothetical protein
MCSDVHLWFFFAGMVTCALMGLSVVGVIMLLGDWHEYSNAGHSRDLSGRAEVEGVHGPGTSR